MMRADKGTLLALTGGVRLVQRVQRPKVHKRKDRGAHYWFFRYRLDQVQPDGQVKTKRKFHTLGPSRGERALTKRQAEAERDRVLAGLSAPTTRSEASVAANQPIDPGMIIFGKLAELWRKDYVEREIGGKPLIAVSTRSKYVSHLENHILPRWKDTRLCQFRTKEISDWLQTTCSSWYAMDDLRNIISGIFTKAIEWEILPDCYANPMHRVKLPPKWSVREKRILTEDETVAVLARLEDPYLLIIETCISAGARISEVLGLQLRHLNLFEGTLSIEQRNWHQNIDKPKTRKSKRKLAIAGLRSRYEGWVTGLTNQDPDAWIFPQAGDRTRPMWDSAVRVELHCAAAAEGCDFPGLGPHSFRRANITWRQEVGASSIEASNIAGHASVRMTEEYTIVQLKRQEELTRRIQDKLAKAKRRLDGKKVIELRKQNATTLAS
jgi:integrase